MKLKNFLINTGLVLVSISIPLIAMEVYLRATNSTPLHANALNSFHIPDPHIGWKGRPDFKGIYKTAEFETLIEYGPDGYRKAQHTTVPREDAKRIAFMGDSFAWGWGVSQGELFSDRLQDLVGDGFNIKNFGINTFCTVQYAIQLEREILDWEPDAIGLMFYSNDFQDNLDSRDGNRPYAEIRDGKAVLTNYPVQNPIGSLARSITIHSYALTSLRYHFNVAKGMLKAWRNQNRGPIKTVGPQQTSIPRQSTRAQHCRLPPGKRERDQGVQYVTADEILAFRTFLKQIQDTAQRHAIPLFMMYVPTGVNIARDVSRRHNYLQVVKQASEDFGIDLIDLTPDFEQGLTGRRGEPYYFTRDVHWTVEGHSVAARKIAPYLIELGANL